MSFFLIITVFFFITVAIAGTLNYGWVHIERTTGNAMQLGCRFVVLNQIFNIDPTTQDVAGDGHIGKGLNIIMRTLTLVDTFFKTTADFEAFINTATVLNLAGHSTVEIQVSSAPAYFQFKSGVGSLEMLFKIIGNARKVAYGDGTVWQVGTIVLRQSG